MIKTYISGRAMLQRLFRKPLDGEGGDEGTGIGTGNDARVALLNSIGDGLDGVRGEDFADINDDGTTAAFVAETPAVQQTEEEDAEDPPADPVDANTQTDLPIAPRMIKLRVNGKDLELSEEDVIARAQKVESADQYLIEAARLKREAAQNAQHAPVTSPEDAAAASREERRALVRAIQMGSEDEAMAALEKLQQPAPAALNAEGLSHAVDQRLDFKQATGWFQQEYADILKDPVLRGMAIQQDQAAVAQGDTRTFAQRYKDIGDGIRNWRASLTPNAAPAAAPSMETRQERKAAAPAPLKVASTRAPAPRVEDDEPESASQVIANMAKARGGPQWTRA